MICKLKADTKILIVILLLLGALIIALAMTSCGVYYEADEVPRQHVNEKCRTIRNEMRVGIGEFIQYVGKKVDQMESLPSVRVYKVRINIGRDVAGNYMAYEAVIYYD